jgi:hypothetical protein
VSQTLDTSALARVRSAAQQAHDRQILATSIDLSDLDELVAAVDSLALAAELREARTQFPGIIEDR